MSAQIEKDTLLASQYYKKADSLLTDKKLDSSIVYFEKALPLYKKTKAWERVARCYNKTSEGLRQKEQYEESHLNAKKALITSKTHLQKNNIEEAFAYDNIGHYYWHKNKKDYKIALEYYQKSLAIRQGFFSSNKLSIAHLNINIGNTLFMQRKYGAALFYYEKSRLIRERELGLDHLETRHNYFQIGLTHYRKEHYNKALNYLKKALLSKTKQLNTNNRITSKTLKVIGDVYRKKGEYDIALTYFKKYLSTLINMHGEKHYTITSALNRIGICYKNKGQYDKALYFYKKAIINEKNLSEKNKEKSDKQVYNNIGIIYKYKGEYAKALDYLKKALHSNKKIGGKQNPHVALNYNNIGNVYRLKKDYDQAVLHYQKALNIRTKIYSTNNSDIAYSYNDIGKLYKLKKEYDTAVHYINKALKIRLHLFKKNHPDVADSHTSLGSVYFNDKAYTNSLVHYQKALTIQSQAYGEHHPKVALSYTNIANVYFYQKDYTNSLLFYDKAIKANTKSKAQYLDQSILLTTLTGKAKTFQKLYDQENNSNHLSDAIKTYQQADTLINAIRQTFTNYQDKVDFSKQAKETYQGAIGAQLLQKGQQSLEKAFYYAEKSKSNTLKELLNEANAKNFTGLPNNLVTVEKELRINKAFYQSKITEEYSEKKMDTSKVTLFENKLFDINRRQDSLTHVLEKNYPKYYLLKYKDDIATVQKIQQQLDDNTTVLEFFTGDSITYAFTISKNNIAVQELSTPKLTEQVEEFRKTIADKNTADFKQQSHHLYNQLIAPAANTFVGDNLIIIPDGSLWHLNFELLLTQHDKSNNPALLSYLLREYAVTYANSANLLFGGTKQQEQTEQLQECLAFSFSDSTQTGETRAMSLAALRDAKGDLPGTRKEIRAISNIIDGQYYYGSQAIETNFKKNAGQYNILHLALHGDVDNERPENSKLYFTKNKDTIEDNLLYSHELFALDIPAELTVLSACNTGTGKIAKGEGIMSLGTAFQYAGTKSLLLTSWEVSDQTTPELMKYFYTNLKDGMSKAKALQQAKLQYLTTADINRLDPFYWGAFYLIGDAAPIPFGNNTLLYWIIVVVLLLSLGGLFWYRKRFRGRVSEV